MCVVSGRFSFAFWAKYACGIVERLHLGRVVLSSKYQRSFRKHGQPNKRVCVI